MRLSSSLDRNKPHLGVLVQRFEETLNAMLYVHILGCWVHNKFRHLHTMQVSDAFINSFIHSICFNSFRFVSFHSLFRFISFHSLFRFISFHSLFRFIHYFTSFLSFHSFISFHFISFHSIHSTCQQYIHLSIGRIQNLAAAPACIKASSSCMASHRRMSISSPNCTRIYFLNYTIHII